MKITEYIAYSIDRLPKGYVFTYADFLDKVKNIAAKRPSKADRSIGKEAVIKALNRMALSGKITKLSKGKFYKSEKSAFGELQPNRYQIVKDLLEENGKITGYLTGYSIYNQLGLTTQISNIIQIGKNAEESKKVKLFERSVKKFNCLNEESDESLIETDERETLCELFDKIALIVNIDVSKYGDGDGIASEWRNW